MSTRTDFFITTTGEVLTMQFPTPLTGGPTVHVYQAGPDGKFPAPAPLFPDHAYVASKNILPDDIADLDFVLTGNRDREPEWVGREQEVGVYRLADELVQAIAQIDDNQLEEIADEWGISDVPATIDLLEKLRSLSRTAIQREEEIFLYLHV